MDAQLQECAGEGIFDSKQGGLRDIRPRQGVLSPGWRSRRRVEQVTEIGPDERSQQLGTAVQLSSKDRVPFVEASRHVQVLSSLAREHEHRWKRREALGTSPSALFERRYCL